MAILLQEEMTMMAITKKFGSGGCDAILGERGIDRRPSTRSHDAGKQSGVHTFTFCGGRVARWYNTLDIPWVKQKKLE